MASYLAVATGVSGKADGHGFGRGHGLGLGLGLGPQHIKW